MKLEAILKLLQALLIQLGVGTLITLVLNDRMPWWTAVIIVVWVIALILLNYREGIEEGRKQHS